MDLYILVLFRDGEEGLVGTYPIYVEEGQSADEILKKEITKYRKVFNSNREKLFKFEQTFENMIDVTNSIKLLF